MLFVWRWICVHCSWAWTTRNATDYHNKCVTFFTHFEIRFTHFNNGEMRVRRLFLVYFFEMHSKRLRSNDENNALWVFVFWSFQQRRHAVLRQMKESIVWNRSTFYFFFVILTTFNTSIFVENKTYEWNGFLLSIPKYYYFKLKRLDFFHLSLFFIWQRKKGTTSQFMS